MTPQLISVQGFAFRGRPLSLLVACAPAGSHLFRCSRRSLRLALQSTARRSETNKTICTITKKTNHSSNRLMNGSFSLGLNYFCPSLFFTFFLRACPRQPWKNKVLKGFVVHNHPVKIVRVVVFCNNVRG